MSERDVVAAYGRRLQAEDLGHEGSLRRNWHSDYHHTMATPKTKQAPKGVTMWFCAIDAHSNTACQREHRRRSVNRSTPLPIPHGHTQCGWILLPSTPDKSFEGAPDDWWKA